MYLKRIVRGPTFAAGVMLLFLVSGCAMMGGTGGPAVKRLPIVDVDKNRVWPFVQVLPNYRFSPECNIDTCAVLFSGGGSGLYVPKVEDRGSGKPADFDLNWLVPYQISDGSILFAPTGSDPFEWRTASGAINIRFGFDPAQEPKDAAGPGIQGR